MLLKLFLLFVPAAFAEDVTQRQLKPVKGVPHSRLNLYQPSTTDTFRCLDGSQTILYSQLNDDYCDCKDGSDEPGTAACGNAHFYCSNVGHRGNFIPTNRVNDKLCDCCDGSDEYDSGVDCPNICDELGRAARIEREKIANVARKGFQKRQELAKEGQTLRDSKLKDVEPLRQERATLEPERSRLETDKKSAEDAERKLQDEHRNQWEAELDLDKSGKIDKEELRQNLFLDEDNDGFVSEDEVNAYLTIDEADPEHFQSLMYDRLKTAKRNHLEDARIKEEEEKERARALENAPDDDDLLAEEDRHDSEDVTSNQESDDDNDKMPEYPPEVQVASEKAREARRLFDEVNQKTQDLDSRIREAEDFANSDYGEDSAWAALKDKCFDRNVQQYTYQFCPFGQNTQKDTGAYSGTSLGSFKEWSGPDGNKYSKMHFGDGQQCWNGPKRSTDITIECGEENELVEVTEPAKCEYLFTFRTPLACSDPDKEVIHDEF
uniref:Glucosidase 2 subunit beta n=1 Tax=Caenorhabditis tropicalis TaxID=1561998 RepID=A0A1I7T4B5_9PELO